MESCSKEIIIFCTSGGDHFTVSYFWITMLTVWKPATHRCRHWCWWQTRHQWSIRHAARLIAILKCVVRHCLFSLRVMFAIIFLGERYVIAPARLASAQFVCFVKLWFGKSVYMRTYPPDSVYCKYHMALHFHCCMRYIDFITICCHISVELRRVNHTTGLY